MVLSVIIQPDQVVTQLGAVLVAARSTDRARNDMNAATRDGPASSNAFQILSYLGKAGVEIRCHRAQMMLDESCVH